MLLRHSISRVGLLVVLETVLATAAFAQTEKANTVISEMFAALGGKSFLDVREIQGSGKVFTFKHDQLSGSEVFWDYVRFPDKERTEYTPYAIKQVNINNGDSGWSVYGKKVDPISPEEAKDFQTGFKTGFQYLARFVLNRPGLLLQLSGSEMIDFKRNDVIEFRDSGNFFRLFVDQQSHLPTKMEVRRSGETVIREEQFANWHVFQGIQTSLYIIHFKDGDKTTEIRFDNISYNRGLADSLFLPPTAR